VTPGPCSTRWRRGSASSSRSPRSPCGGRYFVEHGDRDWPAGSEERCRAADVILLGAVGWNGPDGQPATMKDGKMAGWSPVIGNRIKLNLYANVRPIKLLPGVRHGLSGRFLQAWEPGQVDMIFVRENTEGLYSGIGGAAGDAAIDTRVITRAASRRVIKKAFELSRARGTGAPLDGKKRVTCVVKHNVLHGCKLFLDVYREVAAEFPRRGAGRRDRRLVRDVHAAAPRELRRRRVDQHVRRHPHRPRLGAAGRHGHGGRLQRRRRPRDVRADPRQRAADGRQGRRQPAGDAGRDRRGAALAGPPATATSGWCAAPRAIDEAIAAIVARAASR
jgi:hypothetical protein